MGLLQKLFGKQETPSMHASVANEIRFLSNSVLGSRYIEAKKEIAKELNRDAMQWFEIRPRRYGESGGHYGVAEIPSRPGDPMWPTWLRVIPTSELDDVKFALSDLARNRTPFGGHEMEEENRRRAVGEFASRLLYELFNSEKEARLV